MSNEIALLSDSNNSYPFFEANQLLTSKHLNDLTIYLDVQDRLSRIKLVGIGIVCGLEVAYKDNEITISNGTGITSEGFLVNMGEEVFDRATIARYADPKEYPPFDKPLDEVTGQIPMWELIPKVESADTSLELTESAITISNKVVVLFVEYKDIDLESCVGQNCDDKGVDRQFTIRKLLIECTDVDKIIREYYDIPYSTSLGGTSLNASFNARFDQEYLRMDSFSFIPFNVAPADYPAKYAEMINEDYFNVRYASLYGGPAIGVLGKLGESIVEAYARFGPLLTNLIDSTDIQGLTSTFSTQFNNYYASGYIQYFYDYSRDIIKAYNEFVDGAFEITAECCPEQHMFPRHLVLGKVTNGTGCPENEDTCKPAVYRTHFVQSPIYNQQKEKLNEVRNNFKRLVEMIKNLRINFSLDFNPMDQLKITPSDEKQDKIEKRSIPYYYNASLYKYWNYQYSKKCKTGWNLGYRAGEFGDASPSSIEPLKYDRDPYNFYRIEGLLKKNHSDVCEILETAKRMYGLDFEVLSLKFRANTLENIRDLMRYKKGEGIADPCGMVEKCGMIDIKEDYLQLRNEILSTYTRANEFVIEMLRVVLDILATLAAGMLERVDVNDATQDQFNDTLSEFIAAFGGSITYIAELKETLPKCIDDFDLQVFLEKFNVVNLLFYYITITFEMVFRSTGQYGVFIKYYFERLIIAHGFIGGFSDLYSFLNDDSDIRMGSIFFSYMQRLERREYSKLFSNFAKNNPGLQHMAGVPKGGTFIIVHGEDAVPVKDPATGVLSAPTDDASEVVVADFALHGKACCEDKFPFCSGEEPIYNPIARNIYVFIEGKFNPEKKVDIDVRNHIIDLNHAEIVLSDISTTSVHGMPVYKGLIEGGTLEVMKYQTTVNKAIDSFDYQIHLADDPSRTATGRVYLSYAIPIPTFRMCWPPCKTVKLDTSHETTDYSHGYGLEGDSVRAYSPSNWEYEAADFEGAELFERMTLESNDIPKIQINNTRTKYDNLRGLTAPDADATEREIEKYELDVVYELETLMKETSDQIEFYDKRIGNEPDDLIEKLKFRIEYADDIAARGSLIMLYRNQSKTLATLMDEYDLGKNSEGPVYKFVNEKVRTQITKIGRHGNIARNNFSQFGKKVGKDAVRTDLFKTFEVTT